MIQYTPAKQLTLEGFEHPFDLALDANNRWVKLAALIDWDELAEIYSRNLRGDKGRLSVDVRHVIGALIVKHKLKLSDRETVATIAENLYLQYFCGLKSFQPEPGSSAIRTSQSEDTVKTGNGNKGTLKVDATVADQQIVYPTDLGLLNTARRESERMIDLLYKNPGYRPNHEPTVAWPGRLIWPTAFI